MRVPAEHEAQVQRIISSLDCPHRAECCNPDIERTADAHCLGDADLIECLEKRGHCCPFGLPFGESIFCRCPLRKYLIQHRLG